MSTFCYMFVPIILQKYFKFNSLERKHLFTINYGAYLQKVFKSTAYRSITVCQFYD